jgi:hypothetical protein
MRHQQNANAISGITIQFNIPIIDRTSAISTLTPSTSSGRPLPAITDNQIILDAGPRTAATSARSAGVCLMGGFGEARYTRARSNSTVAGSTSPLRLAN